jgi:hypothetical protein
MMAEMLTYLDSSSTAYLFRNRGRVEFADENYAREIMQLFSIGIYELNNDGSWILGPDQQPILTYTNDQISEFARVWTGFRRQSSRGNKEERFRRTYFFAREVMMPCTLLNLMCVSPFSENRQDPMYIRLDWRDNLPKMGLNEWYIGDGLPLCSDLPDKHFLKTGASYRLLGSYSKPDLLVEPDSWDGDVDVERLSLSTDSDLYQVLCNAATSGGPCNYRSKVELLSDLTCDGTECTIQAPRTFEVGNGIFYEYTRIPCANQAYFNDGQMLKPRGWAFSCGDTRMQIGAPACCEVSTNIFDHQDDRWYTFPGERVDFASASAKCQAVGMDLCRRPWHSCDAFCDSNGLEYWSSTSCSLQAKINLEGSIGLVHAVPPETAAYDGDGDYVHHMVNQNTKTFFRVAWETPVDIYLSQYSATCESLGCGRDPYDNLCLCDATVEEKAAFTSTPSREQVLSQLYVGAFSPLLYYPDLVMTDLGNGMKMYYEDGSAFEAETIFEVVDDFGVTRWRKNLKSMVAIGSSDGLELRFRNPSHVMSVTDPNIRDAQYETEAALDHYFVSST